MSELLYGFDGDEQLNHTDPDEVVGYHLDDLWEPTAHGIQWRLSAVKWPLRVLEFRPMDIKRHVVRFAEITLEELLERCDEEHADPNGGPTEPTENMQKAACAFVDAVLSEYKVWSHEPTGRVLEYTEEQARKIWEAQE
jgi:hypothetical protein